MGYYEPYAVKELRRREFLRRQKRREKMIELTLSALLVIGSEILVIALYLIQHR